MKTLAWILTAAAVVVGADVFVMSADAGTSASTETLVAKDAPIPLQGTSGIPTPPPDAHE